MTSLGRTGIAVHGRTVLSGQGLAAASSGSAVGAGSGG